MSDVEKTKEEKIAEELEKFEAEGWPTAAQDADAEMAEAKKFLDELDEKNLREGAL
jgi:hypothetical protein